MTTIVIQQPTPTEGAPQNIREWSSGVCACFSDCSSCCCGCLCMPCMLCGVMRKLDESCCVCFLPGGLVALRTKLRTQFGIEGSICGDFLTVCCCGPLAVCQIDRELQHFGK